MDLSTRYFLAVVLASLALLAGCARSPKPAAPPAATLTPSTPLIVGINTHFVQRKGILDENIALIKAAGVTSIRDEVPWSQVEREKGKFAFPERCDAYVNAARAAGLDVVIPLGYGNRFYEGGGKPKAPESVAAYLRYCDFVVRHLRGRVTRYEVWNEYNIGIGTAGAEAGTPENYVALLEAAAKTIRAADPNAVVIGGVVAPEALRPGGWLDRALELGLTRHCDVVSVHPYNYRAPAAARTPEALLDNLRRIEAAVRRHSQGRTPPIWVTEHGWPTHAGPGGSSVQLAGDFLARTYLLARTMPAIGGVWWYDFQDDGWDLGESEDVFGAVRADLTPKPAYFALHSIAELVGSAAFEGREPTGTEPLHVLRFRRPDGTRVMAVWSTLEQPAGFQVVLAGGRAVRGQTARVTVVGRPTIERQWVHREWVNLPMAAVEENTLSVFASGTPVLIETGNADVRLGRITRRSTITPPATRPTTIPTGNPATSPATAPTLSPSVEPPAPATQSGD